MQLTKAHLRVLLAFASKDDARPSINQIGITKKGTAIAATNGHVLAVIGTVDHKFGGDAIPLRPFRQALALLRLEPNARRATLRRPARPDPFVELSRSGNMVAITLGDALIWKGSAVGRPKFPPAHSIFPTGKPKLSKPIGIDPKYLRLVELMGACRGDFRHPLASLTFRGPLEVITVSVPDSAPPVRGALMPMRI